MTKIKYFLLFLVFLIIVLISSYTLYNKAKTTAVYNAEDGKALPIIMYHQITTTGSKLNKYAITPEQFESDIKYLKEAGFETITITDLLSHVYDNTPIPEKPIILTFDDGYESFYEYIYPLLKEYKMKAVVSIVGSFTDQFSENEDHNLNYSYLTWKQINEMQNSGYVEIQNHTYDLHKIDNGRKGVAKKSGESLETYKEILEADILKLQQQILMYTGFKPNTLTYPFGSFSEETKEIIKEMGFLAILTCAEKLNSISYDTDWLYSLGRFNRPYNVSTEAFFKKILKNVY